MTTATIADELTCPVCLELYKDPRVLPCQHSLCKSCLVALHSKKDKDSNCDIQCPSCRYIFNATNETHIDAWPHNFTLASIVSKLQASLKDNVFLCDLCDEDQKRRAIKKCMQCQLQYCKVCVEQLHPKRGALANHKLVHIVDSVEEEHKLEEPTSAILSPGSEKSVSFLKYDQLVQHRYCLSCDVMFTKGDQMTAEGSHELHDTTEIHTAFRRKREEFHRTRGRLLDEDMELEKAMASITNQIQTIKKCVEDKKTELLHIFGEVAEEMERTQIAAENKIEEQMKIRVNSLESRLHELEDHKKKTQVKLTSLSELSSLTNEDASIFFMKLKKLQNAIEPVTEDYIQPELKGTGCDSSLPIEQFMNELIANVARDICTSQKRLHAPASTMADTDISSQHASLAIKVTNVQKEGKMCADVEWVAMDQVDHYEISYSCDPSETVLKRNIMENRCKLTSLRWDCEYTITVTAYMPDGKTSFDSRVFKTDLKVKAATLADIDVSPQHGNLAIQVTNVQKEGKMCADVEWVAMDQVDHYEISYSCDPLEKVLQRDIMENRCKLTSLKCDCEYTITVTAYMPDGKTSFDSKMFRTDPNVKASSLADTDVFPQQENLAIKVVNVQKEGRMSADVEWVAIDQVDHYEISYSCDPSEKILQRNIMENRCKLTSLKWDCEYTITVTAFTTDGKSSVDSGVFKTDPKVKETSPAMPDILPNHTYFGINVTNDQNEGTMSADVEWWRVPKAGCYEVSYHCNSGETVVLKTATERRCRLTHLRWNSTYTIKVKAQLQDGNSVFNEHIFSTDPQVKCYPMVVSKICNKQVSMPDSFNEFIASNIFKNWEDFHKVGDFSGVVFTPVLTEEKHFWTMNITLTIFEKGSTQDDFLDFGIVNYAAIEQSTGLTSNDEAYSCCIATSRRGDFILKFESVCCIEGRQYHLPLQLYKESKFCYGFMYDQVNRQFAVMDCLERKVLHVFTSVTFEDNQPPIFAVCPYHDKVKMRVEVKLDYMHYSKENVSYWIRKINAF